jgi:hypothetical protein
VASGFCLVERVEARLIGAHKSQCLPFVHCGTPERLDPVLGLIAAAPAAASPSA